MNFLERATRFFLGLALFLPIAFTPFTMFPWHFGKTVLFQITVELSLLLSCIGLVCYPAWRRRFSERFRSLNWLDLSILLFLGIAFAVSLSGINFFNSFWGTQSRGQGLFTWLHWAAWYFLVTLFFRQEGEWRRLFQISAAVAIVVGLSAVFQGVLPASWRGTGGSRFSGIIGNPVFLASYLVLAIGAVLLSAAWRNSARERGIFFGAALFLLGVLFFTGSRGALIGVSAGIGAAAIISLIFFRGQAQSRRWWLALLGCGVLIVGVITIARLPYVQRHFPALGFFGNFSSALTGSTRLMAWQTAIQGIKERPFLGWGWGNFESVFNRYYNPEFLRFSFQETVWDKPHNWFLEIAVSGGAAAFLAYCLIFFALGRELFGRGGRGISETIEPSRKDFLRYQRVIVGAVITAYLVQSVFLFETSNSLVLLFLFLGFVRFWGGYKSLDNSSEQTTSFYKIKNGIYALLAFGGASTMIWLISCYNVGPLRASYHLSKADSAITSAALLAEAKNTLSLPSVSPGEAGIFLVKKIKQASQWSEVAINSADLIKAGEIVGKSLSAEADRHPEMLSYAQWLGELYLTLGQVKDESYYKQAVYWLKRAEALSPRKQEVLFMLGRAYLLQQKFDLAIEKQRAAVAVADTINTSHWFLGLALVASGDIKTGLKEIEHAFELGYTLTIEQRLYVIDLYAAVKDYPRVVEWYKALVELQPGNVNWYIKLAAAYAVAGQKAEALKTVETAMQMYPPIKEEAEKFIKQYQLR